MADFPLSAAELQDATAAIKEIAYNIDLLRQKVVDGVQLSRREVKDFAKEAETSIEKTERRAHQLYQRLNEDQRGFGNTVFRWSDNWLKQIDQIEHKWDRVGQAIRTHLQEGVGLTGRIGNLLGVSGSGGIFGSISRFSGGVLGSMPMGGLLGLMLYGKMKDTEWAARAYSAARTFNQVGEIGMGTTRNMLSLATRLAGRWGMDPGAVAAEIGQAAQALAQFGVSGPEAMARTNVEMNGLKRNTLEVSFAMDTLLKVAPGTIGSAIGQAAEASGKSVAETTEEVVGLGLSLRNTGANVGQFIGLLMQSTSGLRLQRQSVGDLAKQYQTLYGAFEGGSMRGRGQQYVARSTLAGIQAVAGGVGNLSEGLSAVIGQRIGARTGNKASGIDAIIAMQEGSVGKGGAFMGEVVRELGTLAKEITRNGTRNQQIFSLMKVAPQLGFEGARAVVEINDKIAKDTSKGLSVQESIAAHQGELNKAFMSRDAETSAFEKAMKQLTLALVKIAGGLLQVTISAAMNIVDALKALGALLNPLASAAERGAAMSTMSRIAATQAGGFQQIGEGVGDIGKLGINLFDTAFETDLKSRIRASKAEAAEDERRSREATSADSKATHTAINAARSAVGQIPGADQMDFRQASGARSAFAQAYASAKEGGSGDQAALLAGREALEKTGLFDMGQFTLEVKSEYRVVNKNGGSAPLVAAN